MLTGISVFRLALLFNNHLVVYNILYVYLTHARAHALILTYNTYTQGHLYVPVRPRPANKLCPLNFSISTCINFHLKNKKKCYNMSTS